MNFFRKVKWIYLRDTVTPIDMPYIHVLSLSVGVYGYVYTWLLVDRYINKHSQITHTDIQYLYIHLSVHKYIHVNVGMTCMQVCMYNEERLIKPFLAKLHPNIVCGSCAPVVLDWHVIQIYVSNITSVHSFQAVVYPFKSDIVLRVKHVICWEDIWCYH